MFKNILKEYKNSLKFFIPFEMLLENGIILNKNNGFQSTFKIKFKDLDYLDKAEHYQIIIRLNEAYKSLGDGFTIHFDTIRKKQNYYPKINLDNVPIPTKVIETIREDSIKNIDFYKTEMYITITYLIDNDLTNKISNMNDNYTSILPIRQKSIDEDLEKIEKEFNKELKKFKEKITLFKNKFETTTLEFNLLTDSELLSYLYYTINYKENKNINVPQNFEYMLDEYLANTNIETNLENTKINDEYIKVLTLHAFPNTVYPRIFSDLEKLNFEFRYVTRFINLSEIETKKILKNFRIYYSFKIKNFMQHLLETITKNPVLNTNKEAEYLEYEAEQLQEELVKGDIAYGYYTFTFIIKDKDLEKLEEKVLEVKKVVELKNFTIGDDKFNVIDSYLGAIPGNIVNNIRKLPMNTMLLSSLMPMSTIYQGDIYNSHFNDNCLFTTKTQTDLFYGNLHNKDVGHTLLVGPTGTGKSTILGFLASEFMKYKYKKIENKEIIKKNAKVIFFDKGGSSKVLCELSGGKFYHLGNNELSLQPLKNIDKTDDKRFAIDWITSILEQENIQITPTKRNIIDEAIKSLENSKPENRTLSNFNSFVQDSEIRNAISFYCGNGIYSEYFDNNIDNVENNDFLVFEMGNVINETKIIEPLLSYLFYKIEKDLLDGTPTLIVLDECWTFLKNDKMKNKIEEWLKVLRKKNASVIFATQSLSDITNSSIAPAIIDSCLTSIFLPNNKAETNWNDLYKKFNLNDIEINTIANAIENRDYFIKNKKGSRLFSLNLSNLELSYVSKNSVNDQNVIEIFKNEIEKENIKNKVLALNKIWVEYNFKNNYISDYEYKIFNDVVGDGK